MSVDYPADNNLRFYAPLIDGIGKIHLFRIHSFSVSQLSVFLLVRYSRQEIVDVGGGYVGVLPDHFCIRVVVNWSLSGAVQLKCLLLRKGELLTLRVDLKNNKIINELKDFDILIVLSL